MCCSALGSCGDEQPMKSPSFLGGRGYCKQPDVTYKTHEHLDFPRMLTDQKQQLYI